ncbi:MAG: GGDEF domain-containing protein [Candidatus Hydrogenedentota bacterium]
MLSFDSVKRFKPNHSENNLELKKTLEELFLINNKLKNEVDILSTLREVILSIHSSLELESMLKSILEIIKGFLDIKKILIYLFDPMTSALKPAIGINENKFLQPTQLNTISPAEGIIGNSFALRKSIFAKNETDGNYLICPLFTKDETVGLMILRLNDEIKTVEEHNKNFIDLLSRHIAVGVHNSILYSLAITDGLTGLFVHRYFQLKLEEEYRRAIRYNIPFSLVLLDIDHFKRFNDTYGHQTGDMVLRQIAKIVCSSIRTSDIACRYGGEEIAVIFPSTTLDGAMQASLTIKKNIENFEFSSLNKERFKVTISGGVSTFSPNFTSKEQIIEFTDKALYKAKQNGRNQIVAYKQQIPNAS